jgi:DUF3108-like
MSKHGLVNAVLVGAAIIVLAGCSGVPSGTAPDVPGEATGGPSTGATSLATGAAPVTTSRPSDRQGATSGPSPRPSDRQGATSDPRPGPSDRQGATSDPSPRPSDRQGATSVASPHQAAAAFVKANSIPFPVAVGNTWIYRTTLAGGTGRTTNRIVAAGAGAVGYQVTMDSTTNVAGTATTIPLVYVFYLDGTVGYPVPPVSGLSGMGGSIRWPDAAGLASGQAYRSVMRIPIGQAGQYENADVTVQGTGTASVTVPAGTYQASVVTLTISAKAGTVKVTTWIAQGVGPVQTAALIRVAGMTEYSITNVLLSFARAPAGIGS